MGVVLELVLLVVIVGGAASYLLRGKVASQREAITERRVEAYMQTIRREGRTPELAAMTDTELRDLLLSSAHNLRVQRERRTYLLIGGVVVAVVGAIMVATEEGTRGFGVALLIAALVLYGVNEYLGRQMTAPLVAEGIDVERLRVE